MSQKQVFFEGGGSQEKKVKKKIFKILKSFENS